MNPAPASLSCVSRLLEDPWRRRHQPLIEATLSFLLDHLPCPPHNILDIGGGDGLVAGRLLQRLADAQATVMDIRHDTDGPAIAAALGVSSRLRTVCWNATELDQWPESRSFDLVICRSALHHFSDPARVLRAIAQRLMPGGHLLLSDAFFPDHSAHVWSALNQLRETDFVAYYTYHAILDLLTQAGLRIRLIRPYVFVHEDLDAYLFPASPAIRDDLKRAIYHLDEQTRQEMKLCLGNGTAHFEYTCFDLIADTPDLS